VFSVQNKKENIFLETKPDFSLTGKCFPMTNFSNSKQTQESLESGFPETTFRETNAPLLFIHTQYVVDYNSNTQCIVLFFSNFPFFSFFSFILSKIIFVDFTFLILS